MVVASGMPADELDLDAFMAQAMEYENWEDSHDRVRRFFLEINATHSYSVRRVSEVMRWVQSGEYDRIQRGEYRRRGDETNVREEAGEAMEFYAERFRALFREFGENVTNLGAQVGDASQQVADWLRNAAARAARAARARRTRGRAVRVPASRYRRPASGSRRRSPAGSRAAAPRRSLHRRVTDSRPSVQARAVRARTGLHSSAPRGPRPRPSGAARLRRGGTPGSEP